MKITPPPSFTGLLVLFCSFVVICVVPLNTDAYSQTCSTNDICDSTIENHSIINTAELSTTTKHVTPDIFNNNALKDFERIDAINALNANNRAKMRQMMNIVPPMPQASIGVFNEQRKFTGHEFDPMTDLTYMNARYYESGIGKFVSADPAVVSFNTKSNYGQAMLYDPQLQNSYAYARNNPLLNIDPTGMYNVKTGTIEKGDNEKIIVDSINSAFGINTNWDTVKNVSFYSDRFGDKSPSQITGENLYIGTSMTADITNQLDDLNTTRATVAAQTGMISLGLFAPNMPWDIKNSRDPILGGGTDRQYLSYIYDGELIRYDAPGNINFGYTARAAGLNGNTIQFGALLQQVGDDLIQKKSLSSTDNSGDSQYVQQGIDSYNSQGSWFQKIFGW